MAARPVWPGFEPTRVPLALFDRERTYLLRHPAPPEGFEPVRRRDGWWRSDFVPEAMRANTTVDVAGIPTAGVFLDPDRALTPARVAALLLHEAFHVFEREKHPEWIANEVSLFTYPISDASLLRLRRLETTALRRALTAPDSARRACWVRESLRIRARRFQRLPEESVSYERMTELHEGLARYVERLAASRSAPPSLPAEGFPPESVRERAYPVGRSLAILLDALRPGWKVELERGDASSLDGLLRATVEASPGRVCRSTPDETRRALTVARSDVAALARENRRKRAAFLEAPGWTVEVRAPASALLFPANFDPLNVRRLGGTEVLHTRWLVLRGPAGRIEVLNRPALTEGEGPHPLFGGVKRLRVTGLAREPALRRSGDTLRLSDEGLELELRGVEAMRDGKTLRLVVGG
ncbi:MAG: hypothetical protein ACE5HQ_06180 [Gemmatimonadota bacterium]